MAAAFLAPVLIFKKMRPLIIAAIILVLVLIILFLAPKVTGSCGGMKCAPGFECDNGTCVHSGNIPPPPVPSGNSGGNSSGGSNGGNSGDNNGGNSGDNSGDNSGGSNNGGNNGGGSVKPPPVNPSGNGGSSGDGLHCNPPCGPGLICNPSKNLCWAPPPPTCNPKCGPYDMCGSDGVCHPQKFCAEGAPCTTLGAICQGYGRDGRIGAWTCWTDPRQSGAPLVWRQGTGGDEYCEENGAAGVRGTAGAPGTPTPKCKSIISGNMLCAQPSGGVYDVWQPCRSCNPGSPCGTPGSACANQDIDFKNRLCILNFPDKRFEWIAP